MYCLLIERYLDTKDTRIVGLFMSLSNARSTAYKLRLGKDKIHYDIYLLETGNIYNHLVPIYTTEGDDLPW